MSTRHVPLLAAVLIVRDEAPSLAGCLDSLQGVVDEVHVHDTGSVDGTPEIAARSGAVVTSGPWTDDFAAARNAAQSGWTAQWVIVVDADNRLVADAGLLRQLLSTTSEDVFLVEIDNSHDESPYTHQETRLYRPDRFAWRGRVHEQLVRRDSGRVGGPRVPRNRAYLEHSGYADPGVRAAKARRNVMLAQTSLDELAAQGPHAEPAAVARTLLDLGRSLVAAQRAQDAVDTLEILREMFPGTVEWLQGTDFLVRVLLGAGLPEVSLVLVDQLQSAGAATEYCDWLRAQALAQLGQVATARRLLAGVNRVVDTGGRRHDTRVLRELRRLIGRLDNIQAMTTAPAAEC